MSRPRSDDPHEELYRCLTDSSRKSPRGPFRHAYTEEQFERRIREEASLPLLDEAVSGPPLHAETLRRSQLEDLLNGLGLDGRQLVICRMRLEGQPVRAIAGELKLSERRVWALLKDLRRLLLLRLGGETPDSLAPDDPYYGWQEVFLDSQQR